LLQQAAANTLAQPFPTLMGAVRARIQLCGDVVIEVDGRRCEAGLPGRQGLLVFVYLAANRRRPVGRDELAEALWPGVPPASPESALTVVISKIRSGLGREAVEGRSQLRLGYDDPWIDLEAATEAIHRAEAALARRDWPAAWGPARVALHVAERGFLPWADAPWVLERRRWLEELHLRALRCVAEAGLELGGVELSASERAGRALVRLAPLRETGYATLMRALAARGDVSEALAVYESLRAVLREELGASPAREVQALHGRLLRDEPAPAGANVAERPVWSPGPADNDEGSRR
jgi:pentatricopeptide repeat protein